MTGWTYPASVGMPSETAAPEGTTLLSGPVIEALRNLSRSHAQAVAAAIERIGPDVGQPLKIQPPGHPEGRYMAIVPEGDAPVVIYRRLTPNEGGGYLVTAIVGREEYDGYQLAERQGILDTPVGKLLMIAGAAADAWVTRRKDPNTLPWVRLLARLNDQDRDVRYAAVKALAGREEPGVTKALLARLDDQDERVRAEAAGALAGREEPGVTEALLARLNDQDKDVRYAAVKALAGREEPGVTKALLARLNDQDKDVRYAAVEALAGRVEPGVTEALLARLNDQDE